MNANKLHDSSAETTQQDPRTSVLITGAAGYVGSLVVRALAADRRGLTNIIATDVRQVPPSQRVAGVVHEILDVTRADAVQELMERHAVDTVVHLACIVTPGKAASRQKEYQVDVEGTRNVLQACVATGVRKLLVTSSGAAYGYWPDNPALLTEDDPVRGHDQFAYAVHKRMVEEMLAEHRVSQPQLEQLIFRPGTILGATVHNQITALFEKPVILGLKERATPFVFIWDQDVANAIVQGVHGPQTGIYNLAGDGVMTLREIAAALGKPFVPVPTALLSSALGLLKAWGMTQYGPEQVDFLAYRPVLSNQRLKTQFGMPPKKTTREVFELYRQTHAHA